MYAGVCSQLRQELKRHVCVRMCPALKVEPKHHVCAGGVPSPQEEAQAPRVPAWFFFDSNNNFLKFINDNNNNNNNNNSNSNSNF